jgi:quercetin dioxygenase-like cupin family protein
MQASESLWVLGHKVRPWATDDSYALIEVTSPPKVPGPPPHYHEHEREFFLIMQGELDVMIDGAWKTMRAGDFAELPPRSVHTFVNNAGRDAVWITGWRPKGFQRFFAAFGIPSAEAGARERSASDPVVRKVVEQCETFGMYVAKGA